MNHFRTFLFLFFSCVFIYPADAQFIVKEQVFPVAGYNIFDVGYPRYVARGKDGQFVFLEYWAEGIEGHRISNFYLESYDARTFTEHWFKPITNEGFDPMLGLLDVVSLDGGIFVLGYQNFKEDRITHTVGSYFDYNGKPMADEPVKISNFDKTAKKGFYDKVATSPTKKCMLWMGTDEKRYFMSVWKGDGSKLWDKEMELPWVKEKILCPGYRSRRQGKSLYAPYATEAHLLL